MSRETNIIKRVSHYDNSSLVGSLWGTFKQLFQASYAAADAGGTVAKVESAVFKEDYLERKLKELRDLDKETE